jgi:hypothetical protein
MAAPLRFLTLACTRARLCRRLLFHSQFIVPNAYSFPSSPSSDKSTTRRPFVSAQPHRASPAPTLSGTPAVLRRSPTVEDIEAAELDVELPPLSDTQLVLTERAAEVRRNSASLLVRRFIDAPVLCSNSVKYLLKKNMRVRPCGSPSNRVAATDINIRWSSRGNELPRTSTPRFVVIFSPSSDNVSKSVFEHPVVTQARVIVDVVSLALLRGSTVDFATELIGSSFRVVDNPQAVGSGCGCGVSWEAKI